MYIGIDFGTCYSSIWGFNGVTTEQLFRDPARTGIPSIFGYQIFPNGMKESRVGYACESLVRPENIIRNIKKEIRRKDFRENLRISFCKSAGVDCTREVVFKSILMGIINEGLKSPYMKGQAIDGVVITMPVATDSEHILAAEYKGLIRNAVITGINMFNDEERVKGSNGFAFNPDNVWVAFEPVAAAVNYLEKHKGSSAKKILVFDLGGGTFDVSVVANIAGANGYPYEEIDHDGSLDLGGTNFDIVLRDMVTKELRKIHSDFNWPPARTYQAAKFDSKVMELKHNLSDYKGASFICDQYECWIDRVDFEAQTKSLLDEMMKITKRVIDRNGGKDAFDKIVLVGGASQMPQIRTALERIVPASKIDSTDPSHAIAHGAAYLAKYNKTSDRPLKSPYSYGMRTFWDNGDQLGIHNLIIMGEKSTNGRTISGSGGSYNAHDANTKTVTLRVYESNIPSEVCPKGKWISFDDLKAHPEYRFSELDLSIDLAIPAKYTSAKDYKFIPSLEYSAQKLRLIVTSVEDGTVIGTREISLNDPTGGVK